MGQVALRQAGLGGKILPRHTAPRPSRTHPLAELVEKALIARGFLGGLRKAALRPAAAGLQGLSG
jgi:hypothetical protein